MITVVITGIMLVSTAGVLAAILVRAQKNENEMATLGYPEFIIGWILFGCSILASLHLRLKSEILHEPEQPLQPTVADQDLSCTRRVINFFDPYKSLIANIMLLLDTTFFLRRIQQSLAPKKDEAILLPKGSDIFNIVCAYISIHGLLLAYATIKYAINNYSTCKDICRRVTMAPVIINHNLATVAKAAAPQVIPAPPLNHRRGDESIAPTVVIHGV
jgi:hypothetical protein